MGINLSVTIGNLKLENPVLVASGTFGYGREYEGLVDVNKLGGIVTKTITPKPRQGNPPPRIIETASGMLNAIGLQNDGIDDFVTKKVSFIKKINVPIIASVAGESPEEYAELVKRLDGVDKVAAIELNLSCPNIHERGRSFAQSAKATKDIVEKARKATKKTLIAKLSPNVTDITEIAGAAEAGGADAVSLVNTFLGMAINTEKKKFELANMTGGLSGPAIKPLAIRMVWEVYNAVKIPIIGMGGITTADDAVEFLMAGATAVTVGTASFVDPGASIKIIDGIREYMSRHKIEDINEVTGCLKTS